MCRPRLVSVDFIRMKKPRSGGSSAGEWGLEGAVEWEWGLFRNAIILKLFSVLIMQTEFNHLYTWILFHSKLWCNWDLVQGYQPGMRWTPSWMRSQVPRGIQPQPSDVAWFRVARPFRHDRRGGCSQTHCFRSAPPEENHADQDQQLKEQMPSRWDTNAALRTRENQ